MCLLHAGVDIAVIALWLGCADTRSAQICLYAGMTVKEWSPRPHDTTSVKPGCYPPDSLLAFLESL